MSISIPSHLSVHEINQHKLDVEYKHWIARLNFFEEEFDFIGKLVASSHFTQTEGLSEILMEIPSIKANNNEFLEKVHSYRNNLDLYRECEDLECDNFYLNDHEKFRVVLEQHSASIRKFKKRVFKALGPGL